MSNSDWYAKRLASQQPQTPVRGLVVPAQTPVPQPVGGPPAQVGNVGTGVPAEPMQGGDVSMSDYLAGRTQIKGGQALQVDGNSTCPSCGSGNFFSQKNTPAVYNANNGTAATANPKCFECGYNGRYTQGDQSNWA
jgi:hypothetical protein